MRAGLLALASVIGLALALPAATASATTSATATDLPAPTNTAPITATGSGVGTLVNVRTGLHDAYDRVVFDFTGGTPGYRVEYGTLFAGGTGDPITVAGIVTLRIVFNPAYAHDVNTGAVTYDIRQVLNPGLPTLRQIKFGEDFEAYVSAGLGVNWLGFRVFQLHSPDRVVVDVAHVTTCG
jgi:hypothetical protein